MPPGWLDWLSDADAELLVFGYALPASAALVSILWALVSGPRCTALKLAAAASCAAAAALGPGRSWETGLYGLCAALAAAEC